MDDEPVEPGSLHNRHSQCFSLLNLHVRLHQILADQRVDLLLHARSDHSTQRSTMKLPRERGLDIVGHGELVFFAKPGETERFVFEQTREGAVKHLLVARNQSIGFGAGAKPLCGDGAIVFEDVRIDGFRADDVHSVVESGDNPSIVGFDALFDFGVVAFELVDEEGKAGEDASTPAICVVLH